MGLFPCELNLGPCPCTFYSKHSAPELPLSLTLQTLIGCISILESTSNQNKNGCTYLTHQMGSPVVLAREGR